MSVLYLRNIPAEVGRQLQRLATREGMSVSALAVRELVRVARRADNPDLLADLPDLRRSSDSVVSDIEAGRSER